MDLQAAIEGADQLWLLLVKTYDGILRDKKEVEAKREQLKRKEVIISAFGRHNCGKSTLLNILMGNNCLPEDVRNETGVEVKIRHDRNVHPGPCGDSCNGKCPWLVLEVTDKDQCITEAQGAEDIEKKLHSANEHWRQTGLQNREGRKRYVLYGYVPILENAPCGWTLSLLDTPGFGEANVDHIAAVTDTLFSTSTAYLYIMDSTCMEDAVDAKNIQQLYRHDKDLFNDGRIVVAISKYDLCFSKQSIQKIRIARQRQRVITVDSLQKTAQSFISSNVHVEPPLDVAVPVSAHWASTARFLRQNPHDEETLRDARLILELYPDHHPQGQGGSTMSPQDLASNIESTSGILIVEERLKVMIKCCIHIWETSLVTSYTGYLEEAKSTLLNHRKTQQQHRDETEAKLVLHKQYTSAKTKLANLAYVHGEEKPEIVVSMEQKYDEIDVQQASEHLCEYTGHLIKEFSNEMKGKVGEAAKPLKPRDFKEDMERFLHETTESLNKEKKNVKLEGVASVFNYYLHKMGELDRDLEDTAKKFLPPKWSPGPAYEDLRKDRASREDIFSVFTNEALQSHQLTLGDLQTRAEAPQLKIGWFQRFLESIKKFFGGTVEPDEERQYTKWGKEMDEAIEKLRKEMVKELHAYVANTLKDWVINEVLSVECRNRVKKRMEVLSRTLEQDVKKEKSSVDEAKERCASDDYMQRLDENIERIVAMQENLVPK